MLVHALLGCVDDLWMICQTQIVVGAKIECLAAVSEGDPRLLRRGKDTFLFKESFRTCLSELVFQPTIE
jgi:hypothetical protein